MLRPKEIHDTFSNLATIEEFDIDAVIKALEGLRDHTLDVVQEILQRQANEVESAKAILQSGKPGSVHSSFASTSYITPRVIELHNAVLVAKSMKEEGKTKVQLNPKKDLSYQILAMADSRKFDLKVFPNLYKHKLTND